jgi:hypothetical protein
MTDEECAPTQHCADQPPDENMQSPMRACVDNARCDDGADCGALETCELGVAPPCDPMTTPMCPLPGVCSRSPNGPAPPAGCVGNFDCGPSQICPAQYGGCSEGFDPADGSACPSVCEAACTAADAASTCEPLGLVCNAAEICGEANGPNGMDTITCAGWCVPPR